MKLRDDVDARDESAMAECLPFLCSVSPGLVMCKDGSLLAGFEYSGVDIDNVDPFLLEQCLREIQAAYQCLDERFYVWWCVDKQRDRHYPRSDFPNAAAQRIDDLQRARFERGEMFSIRYRFFLLYTGETGVFAYMETGGGKTTFVNFCLSQFQRYPGAQIIIFDRDHSCRIITGLNEGTHIDIGSGRVRLNPMAAIREGAVGLLWAREFVDRLLAEGGYVTKADDRNAIDHACASLAKSDQILSLSKLAILLPTHLKDNLAEWLGEGPYGMFDNEMDDLGLSDWSCIEMKHILAVERLSRAFLDHAFRQIDKKLSGRPTFIYLEEASFLLNNKAFLPSLDAWLKTFRKKSAFVWMSVQSPESVSGIDDERIRATLADNVPNLLLGFNKRLENHRALYKNMFAMTDEQIDILRDITPKRDYLLVAASTCRIMRSQFDKESLAYLRSEPSFQKMFDDAITGGSTDWRQSYIAQALRRTSS